jgi:NADH-quinone oxidoreductase subunit G
MTAIFINGQPVETGEHRTVLQAALANGFYVPHFCWHPSLSIVGNCRVCVVEHEGRGIDIACNMPISEGMRIQTDSDPVRAQRKAMLQFILLNHPVDCGICDKAGECTLQDYHYAYNGEPALRPATRSCIRPSSSRCRSGSLLDNERCILCSRCVRFTREVSKSHVLGDLEYRGDSMLVAAGVHGRSLDEDPYSDNVVDLCPVGALLSRSFLYQVPRVVPGADNLGVPRLRPRLHGAALAPEGGVAPEGTGRHARTSASSASRRSRTRA